MVSAMSPEGRRIIDSHQKRFAFEHAGAFLLAVIAEGGPTKVQAKGERLYFPMKAGYLTFAWGGEVSALSRGKETFQLSVFYPPWRAAIDRAKARYYRDLPARRAAQEAALQRALGNGGPAVDGPGEGLQGRSIGPAMPPGFEAFGAEVFGIEEEVAPLSRTHFNQHEPLANLRKGDTLRVGQTTFVVHRVIGSYQTDVYKAGVKRPYLLWQKDRDSVSAYVMRGSLDSTFAEPPVMVVDVSKVKIVKRSTP